MSHLCNNVHSVFTNLRDRLPILKSELQKAEASKDYFYPLLLLRSMQGSLEEVRTMIDRQEDMHEMLETRFIGFKDLKLAGFTITPEEAQQLRYIPYSDQLVEQCKETHVLFADPGTSLAELQRWMKNIGVKVVDFSDSESDGRITPTFLNKKEPPSWKLFEVKQLRRKHYPSERNLSEESSQEELLSLRASILCYALLLQLNRSEYLPQDSFFRTREDHLAFYYNDDSYRVSFGYTTDTSVTRPALSRKPDQRI